ncbi:hypothetical protein DMUE_5972, partial [Dictyocoela muelleri]
RLVNHFERICFEGKCKALNNISICDNNRPIVNTDDLYKSTNVTIINKSDNKINKIENKEKVFIKGFNNNEFLLKHNLKEGNIEFKTISPEFMKQNLSKKIYFEGENSNLRINDLELRGLKISTTNDSGLIDDDSSADDLNMKVLISHDLINDDLNIMDLTGKDMIAQDLEIDDCTIKAWEIDDSNIEIYLKIEDSTRDDVPVEEYFDMPDHLLQNFNDSKIEPVSIKNGNDGENEYYVKKISDNKINKNKNMRATIDMTKTVVLNVYDPHYPCEDVKKFIELNGSPWKDKK